MEQQRPVVLSIAGFDPCGGAGLLADIKTFEQHKVYGLGVSTAQTLQTENTFYSIRWEHEKDILIALGTLMQQYDVKIIKIGIVEQFSVLHNLVTFIHQQNSGIRIIIDPVLKSGTGFHFWDEPAELSGWDEVLSKVFLITPNYTEIIQLLPLDNAKAAAQELSRFCNVLLKGGHNLNEPGVDYLYTKDSIEKIETVSGVLPAKHGSGCVLSAAITANLAHGMPLRTACINGKQYIEKFLSGNAGLLGYHYVS